MLYANCAHALALCKPTEVELRQEGAWQLLVTPGTYQRDTNFLEYLLFQVIDTLLGGGQQKGARPLEFVGEELSRRLMRKALAHAQRSISVGTNAQGEDSPIALRRPVKRRRPDAARA